MWGGRFQKAEERSALDFNASVSYDCRMYKEDIAGSLAHASMLADRGIISKEDLEKITRGLLKIKKEKIGKLLKRYSQTLGNIRKLNRIRMYQL